MFVRLTVQFAVVSVSIFYNIHTATDLDRGRRSSTDSLTEFTVRQAARHAELNPVDEDANINLDYVEIGGQLTSSSTRQDNNHRSMGNDDDVIIDWSFLREVWLKQQVDEFQMRLNLMELHSALLAKSMNIIITSNSLNRSRDAMMTLDILSRQLLADMDRLANEDFVGETM